MSEKNISNTDTTTQDAEVMEIPDTLEYYMVTPDGTEIGFVAKDENGEVQEYLYPKEDRSTFFLLEQAYKQLNQATSIKGAAGSLVSSGANTVGGVVNKVAGKQVVDTKKISEKVGVNSHNQTAAKNAQDDDDAVTSDDLKDMFGTFKEVAIEGYTAISGVLDQVDDVRDQIDDINPKKRRARRRAERASERANERAANKQKQAMSNRTLDANNLDSAAQGTKCNVENLEVIQLQNSNSQNNTQNSSQTTPQNNSQNGSQSIPQNIPQNNSQNGSQNMSQSGSQNTSQNAAETQKSGNSQKSDDAADSATQTNGETKTNVTQKNKDTETSIDLENPLEANKSFSSQNDKNASIDKFSN